MLLTPLQSSASRGSLIRRFKRHSPRLVGIEIASDCVRVATLGTINNQGSNPNAAMGWLSQAKFSLGVDLQTAPQPDWLDSLADSLSDLLPRCVDGDPVNAVIALPSPWIHYRTIRESELETTEAQCDAMCQGSIFQSPAHLTKWSLVPGKDHYVVAAVAQSAACRIASAVTSVGYQIEAILPHGVALLHSATALTSLSASAILLLDLSGGLIAISNDLGCGLCRNLPEYSGGRGEETSVDEILPWLEEIASEVNASHRYVGRLGGHFDSNSPLLVCGSATEIAGVDTALAAMLGRPVARWRYAGRRRPVNMSHNDGYRDAEVAVSLSLACCAFDLHKDGRRR